MAELSSCATMQLPKNYSLITTNIISQDGTALGTDIYLPKKKGKIPCVLARTPYDKNTDTVMPLIMPFLNEGFAVVVQDCRGRLTSGGDFFPFVNERKDGLDTVKWIRKQKWSNGKISGFGGSYSGYTQIAIADVLDFATLHVAAGNIYKVIYVYGIFSPKTVFSWGFMMDKPEKEYDVNNAYKILPLSDASIKSYGKTNKFIDEYLKHESYDDFWKKQNYSKFIKCPALFMAGWYDMFLGPQFEDFLALDEKTSKNCRMIVGPWCHGTQVLEKNYGGEEKTGNRDQINNQCVIAELKGEKINKFFVAPYKNTKYNLFIMERNEYVGSEVWPPKETKFTKFYFHNKKQLSTKIQQKNDVLKYTYNPTDPFPSLGGNIFGENVGPADQSSTTSRTDQLIFDMRIKNKPLTLLGPISAELFVETDAKETDFFVSIQDVFPKGPIVNIQTGGTKFIPKNKNKTQKLKIKIWPTGYQINPGHKLRIVITSSGFPAYNRNLNTGEPIYSAKRMAKAKQKIFIGDKFPSSITLPVYTNFSMYIQQYHFYEIYR